MLNIFKILIFSLFISTSFAQDKLKHKDILGAWYCCNKNETYYRSDTIELVSSPVVFECCEEVVWWVKKKTVRKYDSNCTDKFKTVPSPKNYYGKFSFMNTGHKSTLVLCKDNFIMEKFKIVSIQNIELENNSDIIYKRLVLIRTEIN